MPNLNEGQFERLFDPGPETAQPKPQPYVRQAGDPQVEAPGQQVMNFDKPDHPLEVGGRPKRTTKFNMRGEPYEADSPTFDSPPAVLVSEKTDPTYSERMWAVGGGARTPHRPSAVQKNWEALPVERIGPEAQLRTGQNEVERSQVGELKDVDPETYDAHPWVARMKGKSYVLEGHHRLAAARSREGSGEIQAHVVEAEDASDLVRKMRGLPEDPARRM